MYVHNCQIYLPKGRVDLSTLTWLIIVQQILFIFQKISAPFYVGIYYFLGRKCYLLPTRLLGPTYMIIRQVRVSRYQLEGDCWLQNKKKSKITVEFEL